MIPLGSPDEEIYHRYTKLKESWNLADYTDLLEFWLEQIQQNIYPSPYTHVLVDELQDLTCLQLEVVMALADAAKGADRLPWPGFFRHRRSQPVHLRVPWRPAPGCGKNCANAGPSCR